MQNENVVLPAVLSDLYGQVTMFVVELSVVVGALLGKILEG